MRDQRKARRRAKFIARWKPDWSVEGIRQRVERERADEQAADALTEVLPAIPSDDEPTAQLPAVPLPRRKRRYVDQPQDIPPQHPALPPDQELMRRVLDGLHRLPDKPRRRRDVPPGPPK